MRSRADRARRLAELAAHGGAVLLLAWALLESLRTSPPATESFVGPIDSAHLAEWFDAAPASVHARLDVFPSPLERDWLTAMGRSGTSVTWSGPALAPVALTVEPVPHPRGGVRIRVAAAGEVAVRDEAGHLDTARAANGGIVLAARTVVAPVVVAPTASGSDRDAAMTRTPASQPAPASHLTAAPPSEIAPAFTPETATPSPSDAGAARALPMHDLQVGRVLVIGSATWESRFLVAALEEDGWTVVARLAVAPGTWVEQGELGAVDPARYAAAIAVDSAARAFAPGLVRYVRQGGGLVLAGRAAASPPFGTLAVGPPGRYLPSPPGAPPDSASRRALGLHAIASPKSDAVVLERRGALVAVAARRERLGRVMQAGYHDTWRWRMGGGEDGAGAHRAWWSNVVSAVAHAPRQPLTALPVSARIDPAPFARLLDALGPAAEPPAVEPRVHAELRWWVLPMSAILLLSGWASRRLRGAR